MTLRTTQELDYSHGGGNVIPAGTVIEDATRYSVVCNNGYESRYSGWLTVGDGRVFVYSIPPDALERS